MSKWESGMKGQGRIETARLVLRKPIAADAEAIFARYASDAEVTNFLSWRTHQSLADTLQFLAISDAEWDRWPAGPYLIESRTTGALLGSTGLAFETEAVAATGYVLARDAWGRGYATEALTAIVALSRNLGVRHLYALCHPANSASIRVLEKCGFACGERLPESEVFPNLSPGQRLDCLRYTHLTG